MNRFLKIFRRLGAAKSNAGVLQLTLGIGLVITALCASMIMLVYYTRLSFINDSIKDKLRRNVESGIQYLMANRPSMNFNERVRVDLFGDEADSVFMNRKPWGAFELLQSKAWQGKNKYGKAALLTAQPDSIALSCLYLPGNNAVFYLAGNSNLKGTVFFRPGGISPGIFNNKDFKGARLVNGELKRSPDRLPAFDTSLFHQMRLLERKRESNYGTFECETLPKDHHSFLSDTIVHFHSQDSVVLSDSLSGQIIISSEKRIRVLSRARINDIILLAPDIIVEPGFRGRIQCFATRYISVGDSAALRYPSVLSLIGHDEDSLIVLHPKAIVEGLVLITGRSEQMGSKGIFKIHKGATLHGQAYCNSSADIQGNIWGHITARNFLAVVDGFVALNYIVDGTIDATRRSKDMPSALFWANTKTYKIAKWLD